MSSFNRWELLYNYSVKALDQDINRFHKLDDKITKFITLISIIISLLIGTISYVGKSYFPPTNFLELLLIFISFLSFLFFCSVWYLLFSGLKLQKVPRMPFNESTLDAFKSKINDNTILWKLSITCHTALKKHKYINSIKVQYLIKAYEHTKIAAIFLIVDLIIIVLIRFNS